MNCLYFSFALFSYLLMVAILLMFFQSELNNKEDSIYASYIYAIEYGTLEDFKYACVVILLSLFWPISIPLVCVMVLFLILFVLILKIPYLIGKRIFLEMFNKD